MTPNILILALAALIPFLIAFIWFHPKVFGGDTWSKLVGLTAEQQASGIKPLKLILSIGLNFLIAFGLFGMAVHQSGVFSIVGGDAGLLKTGVGAAFLAEYGQNHLTFGHGFFHGIIASLVFAFPILGYATIFERRTGKYLMVNLGFWIISLALMGGVLAQFGGVAV